jgi:hypothetical protein
MKKTLLGLVAIGLIMSCSGLPGFKEPIKPSSVNIRVVTHPGFVQGKEFIDGYTSDAGRMYSADDIGYQVAYDAARKGYHDCIILVELVSRGEEWTKLSLGSKNIWRVSIYKDEPPPDHDDTNSYQSFSMQKMLDP